MAVTKKDKNSVLAAFTSAALSLPGLQAEAAIPIAQPELNLLYGHYQESDDRMQVDVYHLDFVVPFADRLEMGFSIDRDTYSGATPAFSMPASMTNQPKYSQGVTTTHPADIVSAASGGVSPGGLTILGGLDTFVEFVDRRTQNGELLTTTEGTIGAEIDATYTSGLTDAGNELIEGKQTADQNFLAESQAILNNYLTQQNNLNSLKDTTETNYKNEYDTSTNNNNTTRNTALINTQQEYTAAVTNNEDNYNEALTNSNIEYQQAVKNNDAALNTALINTTKTYQDALSNLDPSGYLSQITNNYLQGIDFLAQEKTTERTAIDLNYTSKKTNLSSVYSAQKNALDTNYANEQASIFSLYTAQKSTLDLSYATNKTTLDSNYSNQNTLLDVGYATDKTNALFAKNQGLVTWVNENPKPFSINAAATIDFQEMAYSAYFGKSNLNTGACPGSGDTGCYAEDGFVVGHPDDGTATAHLHQATNGYDAVNDIDLYALSYHSDSSGIYIRAQDGSAFSLDSMNFYAPIGNVNGVANRLNNTSSPTSSNYWATPYWEVLGFNKAVNPNISSGDGTNYSGARVAYTQVANGFNGILSQSYTGPTTLNNQKLDSAFNNINAVWIHFAGFPTTPTNGKTFSMMLDDIKVSPSAPAVQWPIDKQAKETELTATYTNQINVIESQYTTDKTNLTSTYNTQKTTLDLTYTNLISNNETDYNSKKTASTQKYDTQKSTLLSTYSNNITTLDTQYTSEKTQLDAKYASEISKLDAEYNDTLSKVSGDTLEEQKKLQIEYQAKLTTINSTYQQESEKITAKADQEKANIDTAYQQELATINETHQLTVTDITTTHQQEQAKIDTIYNSKLSTLETQYNQELAELNNQKDSDLTLTTAERQQAQTSLDQSFIAQSEKLAAEKAQNETELAAYTQELAKQLTIANYQAILNRMTPQTPIVQKYQQQPLETRTMPTFSGKYYFDDTSLAFSGGMSEEPDFLANFGSVNVSHELNNKLTTLNAGYNVSSNQITRSTDHIHGASEDHDHGNNPEYPSLNETSLFNGFNLGFSQVLNKNTLFQTTANYTNQSGYLSNPYKFVYIRGEVTAAEYYELQQASGGKSIDWNSITQLEMVGTELFREVRPEQRNLWSLSNRINQNIPTLDATVHADYRFYVDDWGINSHTLELKWFQSLPMGITITPSFRYYSQSQADFFAPYFLAPRADGHYSSDFRLADFGAVSGGITFSKTFNKGVTLDAGFEYYTRQSALKLGGGLDTSYADYSYYIVHAGLNINLSAPRFQGMEEHSHHMHHNHGAPLPAGIMYGHMMNTPGDIMVGYRYMYANQTGDMFHGSNAVNDASLLHLACGSNECASRPREMSMNMHMLDIMYAPTDWLNLMLMPQIMDMNMSLSEIPGSSVENEHGSGHSSGDLGDTIMAGMIKVYDAPGHHVHLGLGVSAPTGDVEVTMDGKDPPTSELQDYGMQLGSGTWDFRPSLTYTGVFEKWSWGVQLSGIKRMQDENRVGYALGDAFQSTAWGSYQVLDWLSASIRGIYTEQGAIKGQFNRAHSVSSTVDYPSNYGGRFGDVGFGLNITIPEGPLTGHNLSVEWVQPVADNYNGYQLEREGSLNATWTFAF